MHARMSTIQMDPERIDETVSNLEERDIPEFKKLDGFRGLTLFTDRASGKTFVITYWNSKDQMDASEESVKDARRRAAETGGAKEEPQVERFEVALDTFVR